MGRNLDKKIKLIRMLSPVICSLFFVIYFSSLTGCAGQIHRDKFVISGTYLEIISRDARAAGVAYREFKRLDKIFNFYDPASELSRLNRTYNKKFKASPELFELIKLSKQLNTITNGAFDVSCGNLYFFWNELIHKGNIQEFPSKETIDKIMETCGMDKIRINEADSTIAIEKEGLRIDLSAIAKGYMVDKAASALQKRGIKDTIINAGGDIYCLGTNRGIPWSVGIRNPGELGGVFQNESLFNEAMATSGSYEQFFDFQGKRYSHIIDPNTGYPVSTNILSVSVITKNCTTADGFATAFFVSGTSGIKRFLANNRSTMRIFIIMDEGKKKRIHIFK